MKKRVFAVLLILVLAAGAFTGCGGDKDSGDATTVKIGVTGSVHEDIWAPAIEALAAEGIEVELVQFSDFTLPNNALANGDVDLNAFQHLLFMNNEIEENGYEITKIANEYSTHMNLYSAHIDAIDELKAGDVIAIPNDVTNGGVALKVLQDAGIIKLKEDAPFSPTLDDIESYNYDVTIEELAANTIPSALEDVTAAIVNVNYAIDYGFEMEDALYIGKLDEEEYWTLIAARTEDLADPEKVALYDKIIEAVQSEATEKVFAEEFDGYYEAAGWDEDLLAEYRK